MATLTDEQYDIAAQLVEECKSLQRIEDQYQRNTSSSRNQELWQRLKEEKSANVDQLKAALKNIL